MEEASNLQSSQDQIEATEAQIEELSKRIEFYLTEYSIELLVMKMNNQEFIVPDYQRNFTWDENRQSRFIESILMGLPIPFLFFWESSSGILEIIDGSQRLRTLTAFLRNTLILQNLEVLTLLNGFSCEDLPKSRLRKFKNRSIRGVILNDHADEKTRFELFDRINTGPQIPKPTEVRRGALNGPFQDFLNKLALDNEFCKLAPVTKTQEDKREREELLGRFYAYSDGLEEYRDRPSDFIFDYTKKMNTEFLKDQELEKSYNKRLTEVLEFVNRNFPLGFRKSEKAKTTPRARFEAIALGTHYALKEKPGLASQTVDVSEWISSDAFQKIVGSDGANAKRRLNDRIDFVKQKLLKRQAK